MRLNWMLLAAAACLAATAVAPGPAGAQNPVTATHGPPPSVGIPLSGRVMTPDGKPVPNVAVHITIRSPYSTIDKTSGAQIQTVQVSAQDLTTDTQGRYATNGIKPGDSVTIFVNEPGYRYVSGGVLAGVAGGYVASDLVVEAPTATLTGVVVDTSGNPVAGADVIAPQDNPASGATTDPNGRFTLTLLPAGQVDLIAGGAAGFAVATYKTGDNVTVTLQPAPGQAPQDISDATSVLTGAYQEAANAKYPAADLMALDLAGVDPAAAIKLVTARGAKPADNTLYGIALAAARANPSRASELVPGIIDQMTDPGAKAIAASYIGHYFVSVDKDTAQKLLTMARTADVGASFVKYGGADQVSVAALAYHLGDRNAMKTVDDAIKTLRDTVAEMQKQSPGQVDPEMVDTTLSAYAEAVAPAGPDMINHVLDQMEAPSGNWNPRLLPRTRAIETLADFDPEAALDMLQKTTINSDIGEALYGPAAVATLEQLGNSDPAGSVAIAQKVTDNDSLPVVLTLAARTQPVNIAAPMFREAMAAALKASHPSALAGWVAAEAWEVDQNLGTELFKSAWTQLNGVSLMGGVAGGLAPFAYFYYRVDPIESRMVVEREFANAALASRVANVGDDLIPPVLAMCAMDLNRALALANHLPGAARYETLRKIAQYMIATPDVKRTIRFDRWLVLDGWVPGRPTVQ